MQLIPGYLLTKISATKFLTVSEWPPPPPTFPTNEIVDIGLANTAISSESYE